MNLMEEKFKEAINKKHNDINTFIWKGSKSLDVNGKYQQEEKRMIDMNEYELNVCYDYCKTMLFNKDINKPGRYLVLELISDQKDRIGAELFIRYAEQNHNFKRFTLLDAINGFLNINKDIFKNYKPTVVDAIPEAPAEFKKVPLTLVIDGCLDRLGTLNKKHITRTFILKQGIWLTPEESKDLIEYTPDGVLRERLEVIKERLRIKEDVEKLYLNSKGLNYTQIRALLNIKANKKYLDLTTAQLETLRYRLLFNLEESVKEHIAAWENRMSQLEKIAEFKKYKL